MNLKKSIRESFEFVFNHHNHALSRLLTDRIYNRSSNHTDLPIEWITMKCMRESIYLTLSSNLKH